MATPYGDFESLPPELLLPILSHLPDLVSLDSLLRASPAALRVFEIQSVTIFKTILSSGNTHTYTSALIRIIALIRADALPPCVHNLTDFKDLVRFETSPHRWECRREDGPPQPRWDAPSSWPSDLPTAILRGLLVTNRKIQHLTFGCLEYYFNQFKPLRPFNSAEYSFDSSYFRKETNELIGAWLDKPAGVEYVYPVQDAGPPSWLEEQRVLRAFWRIQLAHEVNAEIDAGCLASWKEKGEHFRTGPADFCDVPSCFFDKKGGNCVRYRKMRILRLETLLEHELLDSALEYRQQVEQAISESKYWQLKGKWAAGLATKSEEDWQTLDITWESNMWTVFYHISGDPGTHDFYPFSPLQHASFDLWRRYGFAIWSTARMAGYGLLLPMEAYPQGLEKPIYEAWRSLLTQDEKEAVDNETKKWEEDAD